VDRKTVESVVVAAAVAAAAAVAVGDEIYSWEYLGQVELMEQM